MKYIGKLLVVLIAFLITVSLLLSSCGKEMTQSAPVISTSQPSSSTTAVPVTQTVTTATEISSAANWWDEFGTPQYGGTMILRCGGIAGFNGDPGQLIGGGYMLWFENLFIDNSWTTDRSVEPFNGEFINQENYGGWLAESWEWADPTTATIHLRQGIKFQNKAPVNGRELTSADVVRHFDRLMGTGSGFTTPNPFYIGDFVNVQKVVALDKDTIQFKFKQAGVLGAYAFLFFPTNDGYIEPLELEQQQLLADWKSANGTGPWILTDWTNDVSITYSKNPDYWGYDERYPKNKLPYMDSIKAIAIVDASTTLAAIRTGRVDMVSNFYNTQGLSWQDGATLSKSSPEINQAKQPKPGEIIILRVDNKPFDNIKVRKALQMAIDLKKLAQSIYGSTVDGTPCGITNPASKGWALPYLQWPADLQAEYTYNPTKAKALLTEAGYPDGFSTKCLTSVQAGTELPQAVKAMFKDIGVEMELQNLEFNVMMSTLYSGKNDAMVFFGGQVGKMETMKLNTPSKGNWYHFNDPQFDSLVDQINFASTVEKAQKASIESDIYYLQQHWGITFFP